MSHATAALAWSITRASSRQSFLTARLLADKDLIDDCMRAYAYFRWVDDVVDDASPSAAERIAFVQRQRELIDGLYQDKPLDDLTPEEKLIADLIRNDRGENSGLQSFIRNFLAIIEFDAHRRGRLISGDELAWYSNCLGRAVTDAIQYFIGNGHPYPAAENRYLAATAAHLTHMLRDTLLDVGDGYYNIPRDYLEQNGIGPEDVKSAPYQAWVRERVHLARRYIREGKRYLDELEVLRCKIAGYWYCARFESVLDTIERDGYVLRPEYDERRKPAIWLKMAWLGVSTSLKHVARQPHAHQEQATSALEPRGQKCAPILDS
jgi:phytoene/squalene synthetase